MNRVLYTPHELRAQVFFPRTAPCESRLSPNLLPLSPPSVLITSVSASIRCVNVPFFSSSAPSLRPLIFKSFSAHLVHHRVNHIRLNDSGIHLLSGQSITSMKWVSLLYTTIFLAGIIRIGPTCRKLLRFRGTDEAAARRSIRHATRERENTPFLNVCPDAWGGEPNG